MYSEREGIVRKCVRTLQTSIANGYPFSEPDSVSLTRKQYQATSQTRTARFSRNVFIVRSSLETEFVQRAKKSIL